MTIYAVGCIVEVDGNILLLQRQPHKCEPLCWGLVGGKVEADEDLLAAIRRELSEETGIIPEDDPLLLNEDVYDLSYGRVSFPVFRLKFDKRPAISINEKEHLKYKWVKPRDIIKLDGMEGLDELLKRTGYIKDEH